jgi:hypothetical protein
MKRCCVLVLLLLLAVSICSHAQTLQIQTLTVQAAWGGLGRPSHSDFSAHRLGDSYRANGRNIPSTLLNALLNAVQEAPLIVPTAANLGITAQWLREHADQAGGHASRLYYKEGLPEQKALFREAFEDQRTLPSRLKQVYETFHTDDYPHMQAQLVLQSGVRVVLTSDSQNPLMLPWCVTANVTTTKTYNANISHALFALLSPRFDNRERLTDEPDSSLGLVGMLGEETANTVEGRWELVWAQHASADALAVLRRVYQVRSATVNSFHDLAFGKAWDGGEPHEENLHATLWSEGFPKGFTVTAILLRQNGNTKGASELLKRVPMYTDLVFSVPWLDAYLKSHPEEHASMFYVHGESLTDKAMRVFADDMKAIGRNDLVERVHTAQHEAALLESGHGDYWIILPEKTAILWRWQSLDHILKWKVIDFPAHECTDYRTVSGGCAGVAIFPGGVAESINTKQTSSAVATPH